MSKLSIGFALGGGGARGAAHIGVLKVLHKNGIVPDVIGGTSAGAIIGAMYAATKDTEWVEDRFRNFLNSDEYESMGVERLESDHPESVIGQVTKFVQDRLVIAMALTRNSIVKKSRLTNALEFLIPVRSFEELKIPLTVFATDLQSGDTISYDSGELIDAVVQSGSIPGFIEPTFEDGKLIVDAGVSAPLPVSQVKDKVDFTIGIDISRGYPKEPMRKTNIIEIITRSERITSQYYTDMLAKNADFLIKPDVMGLNWSAFDKFEELLQNGTDEAKLRLPQLKQTLKYRKSLRYRLFHMSSK